MAIFWLLSDFVATLATNCCFFAILATFDKSWRFWLLIFVFVILATFDKSWRFWAICRFGILLLSSRPKLTIKLMISFLKLQNANLMVGINCYYPPFYVRDFGQRRDDCKKEV